VLNNSTHPWEVSSTAHGGRSTLFVATIALTRDFWLARITALLVGGSGSLCRTLLEVLEGRAGEPSERTGRDISAAK